MKSKMSSYRPMSYHRGFSLIVGLIMLSLMTLLAVTTYIVGTNQTIIVANAQHRSEGVDAAQGAIALVANSGNFVNDPAAAIPASNCGAGANRLCVDTNSDGTNDFTVTLNPQPRCVTSSIIDVNDLDISLAEDFNCTKGTEQAGHGSFDAEGNSSSTASGNSLCANAIWEITAVAVDTSTDTSVTVIQGLASRDPADAISTNCP